MKFNWKTKSFIGGLLTLVLVGLGVENADMWSGVGTAAICEKVKCDA